MRAVILMLAVALCFGSANALVPHQINYQGYLTNPGGTPVNASVTMALNLYTVATGGAALYTETQTVSVTNGVFNVLIGPQQAAQFLLLAFDVPYYLGIMVAPDAEMTPRQPIAASAYAIRSATTEALAPTATVPASQITGAIGSATSFTGNLAGDVTGTQLATVVGAVGGASAANVAAGANLANVATNANTANTIVKRDASGNFSVGTITGNVSGSAASFTGVLAGDVTGTQGATAIAAPTVTGKVLTGFASGAGTIAATDTVLTAINKLDGNVAAKAPLASPVFTGAVGIGTTTAAAATLHVRKDTPFGVGPTLLVQNGGGGTNAASRIDLATYVIGANPPGARITAIDSGNSSANVDIQTKVPGADANALASRLFIRNDGNVGVGTSSPGSKLAVAGVMESTSGGVKFPDSTLQTTAATKTAYQNMKVVAKSGGDFSTIGAALAAITDNTATNRYLVYVAPGIYSEQVTMKPYVDIEGAGELPTKITSVGSGASNIATVLGASDAELRFLTVENTGGNQYAVAVYNSGTAPNLTHISANASGGTQMSAGVLYEGSPSATMKDVTANVTGSAGQFNVGVYNSNSSVIISSSDINASGGAVNWGIKNSWSVAGAYVVQVNRSRISGSTNTISNDTFFTTRVGASQLSGGPVFSVVGTLTCVGVYDENYVSAGYTTCPQSNRCRSPILAAKRKGARFVRDPGGRARRMAGVRASAAVQWPTCLRGRTAQPETPGQNVVDRRPTTTSSEDAMIRQRIVRLALGMTLAGSYVA